jgi:hypothetical protein
MRTHFVVVAPPCFNNDLCFGTRAKPFEAQTLIAKLAVEAFRDAILPRLAGLDQRGADPLRDDPGQDRLRHELRAVVAAQEGRCAALTDQARQDFDHTWRADTAIDIDRQSFLGELVGHRQTLELLTIGTMIEHEIIRPHLVRPTRRVRARPSSSDALPWASEDTELGVLMELEVGHGETEVYPRVQA